MWPLFVCRRISKLVKRAKPSVFFNSGSFLHKSITLQLHMTRVIITWKPTPRSGQDLNAEMQDSWDSQGQPVEAQWAGQSGDKQGAGTLWEVKGGALHIMDLS